MDFIISILIKYKFAYFMDSHELPRGSPLRACCVICVGEVRTCLGLRGLYWKSSCRDAQRGKLCFGAQTADKRKRPAHVWRCDFKTNNATNKRNAKTNHTIQKSNLFIEVVVVRMRQLISAPARTSSGKLCSPVRVAVTQRWTIRQLVQRGPAT